MSDTLIENTHIAARRAAGEPDWLIARRQAAWEKSQTLSLPRLEKTDISRWKLEEALPASAAAAPGAAPASSAKSAYLATANGAGAGGFVEPQLAAKGVELLSFGAALEKLGDRLEPFLLTAEPSTPDVLTALHTAYVDGGAVLYVPRGVEIEDPIEIRQSFGTVSGYPHTLIVLDDMARATVVETLTSFDEERLTLNAALEVHLGQGAFLRYAGIQKLSTGVRMTYPHLATLDRDAGIEWILVSSGGGRVITNNETLLEGEGAHAQSYAVFLTDGRQVLDIQTKMQHYASHTTSDMDSKGVLKDASRVTYVGFTNIRKYSRGCASWQNEKTLMLSPDCRADLMPLLWIDDDDVVRAGHAAAAGQVNQEQLYYLMTRGVPEKEAMLLLVNGFLETIIGRIPLDEIREEIMSLAAEKVKA